MVILQIEVNDKNSHTTKRTKSHFKKKKKKKRKHNKEINWERTTQKRSEIHITDDTQ